MGQDYDLTENDNSTMVVPCRNRSNGQYIDLTGRTATLRWWTAAGTKIEHAMTVVAADPTDVVTYPYKVSYLFADGEASPPRMRFEIDIQDAFGNTIHVLNVIELTVRPALG